MIRKKSLLLAMSSLLVLSMASCGGDGPNTPSSNDSAAGSWDFSRNEKNGKYVDLTLGHSRIPEGTNFYDGCAPTVTYVDGDQREDYTEEKNRIVFSVVSRTDESITYSAGDALPAGQYYAEAKAPSKSRFDRKPFEVVAETVEQASEGHGYHTVTRESMADAAVGKHAALGALGDGKFPSVGNPKLIVIPVQFTNAQFPDAAKAREVLYRAFFATNEELGEHEWESLSSYYQKSSYGLLNIRGMEGFDMGISPVYTANVSTDQYEQGQASAHSIMADAVQWLVANHGLNRADYDADGDGYIDGVEMVYITDKQPRSSEGDSTWWNYTSCSSTSPNKANPTPHRLFWSRYDYVMNAYYKGAPGYENQDVDAHTIIHETGHMMGLNDYYSYAKEAEKKGPAGCVDMMDMNVGDHNAYSKMMYNWVDAKVVDGSSKNFSITLNSYTDTGDFLVLRDTNEDPWNETPYDEYMILEYYTPTGVNEKDSKGYGEWQSTQEGKNSYGHGGTYDRPGLMAFHVDSRLGATWGTYDKQTMRTTQTGRGYVDEIRDEPEYKEDGTYFSASVAPHQNTLHSGDGRQSVDYETGQAGDYCEIHAIFSGANNGLDSTSYYSTFGEHVNLFGLEEYGRKPSDDPTKPVYGGSTFSRYKHREWFLKDLKWDDGSTCTWTWSVTAQTDDTITLHFVDNSAIK